MTYERAKLIREFRLKQPIDELERKAHKSIERARLWTQEELDAGEARARELAEFFADNEIIE